MKTAIATLVLSSVFAFSAQTYAAPESGASNPCPNGYVKRSECVDKAGFKNVNIVAVPFNAVTANGTLFFCGWNEKFTKAANDFDLENACQIQEDESN